MNTLLHLDVEVWPAKLLPAQPLSDEAFEAFCLKNDNVRIERSRDGEIFMHYTRGGEAVAVSGDSIAGTGPVEGFLLDLTEIWRCCEQ